MRDKPTAKQQRFINHYIASGNASEAVRQAGYKTKQPDVMGYQLLRNATVIEAIDAVAQIDKNAAILTKEERQILLSQIAMDEESYTAAERIRAIDILNKMDGLYLQNVELSGSIDVPTIIIDFPDPHADQLKE